MPARHITTRISIVLGCQVWLALSQSAQWAQFGSDSQHSFRSPYSGPSSAAQARLYMSGGFAVAPAVSTPSVAVDGSIILCSGDAVYALDAARGAPAWSFAPPGGFDIHMTPAVSAVGTVIVASSNGVAYGLNLSSGAELWRYQTVGHSFFSPAIGPGGRVILSGNNASDYSRAYWYALDGNTGKLLWVSKELGGQYASPAFSVAGDTAFIACQAQ